MNFSLWSMLHSDGLHYLILLLPERPLLGLIGEADTPPVIFCCDQHGWHSDLEYFYNVNNPTPSISALSEFSDVSFQKNIEGSSPLLRAPTDFFISDIFGGIS